MNRNLDSGPTKEQGAEREGGAEQGRSRAEWEPDQGEREGGVGGGAGAERGGGGGGAGAEQREEQEVPVPCKATVGTYPCVLDIM